MMQILENKRQTRGTLVFENVKGYEDVSAQQLKEMKFHIKQLRFIFSDYNCVINLLYVIFSIIGISYNELFYSVLLLDIVRRWELLTSVVKAIYYNSKQLGQTTVLLIVIIYCYGIIAFSFFSDHYEYVGFLYCFYSL
jgi:hypothetical protein